MSMDLTNLSSNWKILQPRIPRPEHKSAATNTDPRGQSLSTHSQNTQHALKRKRSQPSSQALNGRTYSTHHPAPRLRKRAKHHPTASMATPSEPTPVGSAASSTSTSTNSSSQINAGLNPTTTLGKYLALDCEMVGVGPHGTDSALARVSIVNYSNLQVYDSFVLPKEEVTDWRTPISGIKPVHMKHARSFEEVQADVARIISGRILVGHALRHDFKVLMLSHPEVDVRDTSRLASYRRLTGGTPKLQLLASELLGIEIQGGEHSSLEDARACMLLFRRDKDEFEAKGKMKKSKRVR